MAFEVPIVPVVPNITLPNVVPAALQGTPSPNIPTLMDFFETRNFSRLFGALGVATTALVAYVLYQKFTEGCLKTEVEELPQMIPPPTIEEDPIPEEEPVEEVKEEEEDTKVILYQVPRGFFTPAVAPFALKLETFIRIAKIPYEVHLSTAKHEVDTPWLKVGKEEISSNNECVSFLCKKFDIDLSKGASNSRKTASRMADVMLDSRIYWAIALWRWVYDEGKSLKDIQPLAPSGEAVLENVRESVLRAACYQGIGKDSKEQVVSSVIQDLGHLAAALGKHPYFMGATPGEVDCNAFSLLAQMIWNMPASPFEEAIKKQKPLMDFVIRMREQFWPDWDELVQHQEESRVSSQTSIVDPVFEKTRKGSTTSVRSSASIRLVASPTSEGRDENKDSYDTGFTKSRSNLVDQLPLRQEEKYEVPQVGNPVTFQEAPNQAQYASNKFNLTEDQLNKLKLHQQAIVQAEAQNRFQKDFKGNQNIGNPIDTNNHYSQEYESNEPKNISYYDQQQFRTIDFQGTNYQKDNYDGETYYPDVQPGFMQDSLNRANAAFYQQTYPNGNENYDQSEFNREQNQYQQHVQFHSQPQKMNNDYVTRRPVSIQSEQFDKYWH